MMKMWSTWKPPVGPNENIEVSVSALAKRIGAPLLTDLAVEFEFDEPTPANVPAPIHQTYPRQLTDLFAGEQLVCFIEVAADRTAADAAPGVGPRFDLSVDYAACRNQAPPG